MSKRLSKLGENKKPKKVNQPKRLTYRQPSGVKTYNLHELAKTRLCIRCKLAQWPSGPVASGAVVQRNSGQAAYNSTATYTDSCIAPSSNRKSTTLGAKTLSLIQKGNSCSRHGEKHLYHSQRRDNP